MVVLSRGGDRMKHIGFVYQTTNLLSNRKYIGKCKFNRINDWRKYLGSGVQLKEDIKKLGKENFKRDILLLALTDESLEEFEESIIENLRAVESDEYYNLKKSSVGGDTFTYNPNKEEYRRKKSMASSGVRNPQYGKPKTQKMIDSVKKANSKKIIVDGVTYNSITEYAKLFGIGNGTVNYRLKSKHFSNYQYA
jgi:hypothetical protein